MCFTIEKNIQVNLKEVYPKFYSMKFNRIISKLLIINQRYAYLSKLTVEYELERPDINLEVRGFRKRVSR